jgi:two-component sensor histidine kinase
MTEISTTRSLDERAGALEGEGRQTELQLRRQVAELEQALARCEEDIASHRDLYGVDPGSEQWALRVREVDHRAKNSLQLAASMLHMQARKADDRDVREHLEAASDRLKIFARLHSVLHEGASQDGVLLKPWLERVCEGLSMDPQVRITVTAPDETWPADLARPIGLFIFEAVTNSLKHAFQDASTGRVEVSLVRTPPSCRVEVADDGCGPSPGAHSGLGSALFPIFASQLNGELVVNRGLDDRGYRVGIVFNGPVDLVAQAVPAEAAEPSRHRRPQTTGG